LAAAGTARSAAFLAMHRDEGDMPWGEPESADRWHWWYWLRHPALAWRIWRRDQA
jgi:hypothetical protein